MFKGLIKSFTLLGEDVIGVVTAPVEIAVDTARVITKPIADMSKDISKEVKKSTEET